MCARHSFVVLAIFAFFSANACAGLFDDQEARRLANEAKKQADSRFEQQTSSLLEFATQMQLQADEIASLRGQIETLQYELEQSKKRQQDLYLDLDNRLRRFESAGNIASETAPVANSEFSKNTAHLQNAPEVKTTTVNETAQYDVALADFKAERYKKAAQGFQTFIKRFPNSPLFAKAHYWLGTSFYAQGQCTKAIAAHQVVIERFPDSENAPDSWLCVALCQQELGNMGSARRSLNQIVKKYPKTAAAKTAQERLKQMVNE